MAAHGYKTHAFEPTNANYVLTHCALALSNIKAPVRFNHFGLGAETQSACIESVGNNMGDSVAHVEYTNCDAAKRAEIGTLNHYYNSFLRSRKVALIKIDIRGFELIAFEHGTDLFDSEDAPEVVIFEWEPYRMRNKGSNPSDLFRFFEKRGYLMFNVNDGIVIDS
jgi:FkbM family methyltransferase